MNTIVAFGLKPLRTFSILPRVTATLGLTAALVIASLVGVSVLSDTSVRIATAIDLAGSLRWRATALFIQDEKPERTAAEFDSRLNHPELTQAIPADPRHPLRTAYNAVRDRWHKEIREPFLTGALLGKSSSANLRSEYVEEITGLVHLLRDDHTRHVRMLHALEISVLVLMIFSISASFWLMHVRVMAPLKDVMRIARRIRNGDWSGRAMVTHDDELGQFGSDFNALIGELHHSQTLLEDRVREKTAELTHSNRQLELLHKLLYHAVRSLSEENPSRDTIRQVLDNLRETIDASIVCLHLVSDNTALLGSAGKFPPVKVPFRDMLAIAWNCEKIGCTGCPGKAWIHGTHASSENDADRLHAIPIPDAHRPELVLTLKLSGDEPWKLDAARAVARHIHSALDHLRRDEVRHRSLVLEERATIARELHDSLAQALTYANVQTSRLEKLDSVKRDPDSARITQELKSGIDTAYRRLRELITTFRIELEDKNFHALIEETARHFSTRLNLNLHIDSTCPAFDAMSASENLHALQIVREALFNAAQHSRSSRVELRIDRHEQKGLRVRIEDDGHGIKSLGDESSSGEGHGLAIMRERAAILGGSIDIGDREGGGTRVELLFIPQEQQPKPELRHLI